jgi:hypothetical protein
VNPTRDGSPYLPGYEPIVAAPIPTEVWPKPTTDLEYREAAVRLAIAHFEAKGMKTTQDWEIVAIAKQFEQYLRNG